MRKVKFAGVQQHYVHAREVQGDVLCLWAPLSPLKRTYRTILEISPINFLLKAEEEQGALLDRYGALLKSLTFPIQIIIRNQPLDFRPYLAQIQEQARAFRAMEDRGEASEQDMGCWPDLAADLEMLLNRLGSQRTLLTRACYLVIPAPDSFGPAQRRMLGRKKQRRVREEALRSRALQELAVRVEMLESGLQSLGLLSRRLEGEDVARFYHSCLTPLRAQNHPLSNEQLLVAGRLPRVKHPLTGEKRIASEIISPSPRNTSSMEVETDATEKPDYVQEERASPDTPPRRRGLWRRHPRSTQGHHTSRRTLSKHSPAEIVPPADVIHLADLLAPGSIQEFPDAVCIGGGIDGSEEWVRGIAVTAFPREVSMNGWLVGSMSSSVSKCRGWLLLRGDWHLQRDKPQAAYHCVEEQQTAILITERSSHLVGASFDLLK